MPHVPVCGGLGKGRGEELDPVALGTGPIAGSGTAQAEQRAADPSTELSQITILATE